MRLLALACAAHSGRLWGVLAPKEGMEMGDDKREQQVKSGHAKGKRQRRGRDRCPQAVARSVESCVWCWRVVEVRERHARVGEMRPTCDLVTRPCPLILGYLSFSNARSGHAYILSEQVVYAWCCWAVCICGWQGPRSLNPASSPLSNLLPPLPSNFQSHSAAGPTKPWTTWRTRTCA